MLRSRISIASSNGTFPPSRCSISPSNLSFIPSLFHGGQLTDAVVERLLPGRFHLRIRAPEAFPHLVRGHRGDQACAVDDVGGGPGLHHRGGGAAARRK